MEMPTLFPLEEFGQEPSLNYKDEFETGLKKIPGGERSDDLAGIREAQEPDGTETAVPNPLGLSGAIGDSAGTGERISAEDTPSIYEATGLIGPFKLDPLALVFPDTPEEDLMTLADNIKAIGMLEEPTVAWTQGTEGPPQIIDGKRILKAAEIAGVQPTYRLLSRDIDPWHYVWAKNAVRRHLTPSQRAMAFAALFPSSGPGRPSGSGGNCPMFDNLSTRPTQGQGAKAMGVSRTLVNEADHIIAAIEGGRVAPEVGEAIRVGTITGSDAVKDNVRDASQEVQREALSQVKDGRSRTFSAAIEKVERESLQRIDEPPSRLPRPTRIGKSAELYICSVHALIRRVKPGTVDLVLAHPPESVRLGFFSRIAELADHVLSDEGVLLVVVLAIGRLREILDRLSRRRPEFIAEFSLLFPAPVNDLGDPHYVKVRRAAVLVFGKHGAKVAAGDDVIEVPAKDGGVGEDGFMDLKEGLPLVVSRFALSRQKVCIPTLADNGGAVLAALNAGCTVIGADSDQAIIDEVVVEISQLKGDSSTVDQDDQ